MRSNFQKRSVQLSKAETLRWSKDAAFREKAKDEARKLSASKYPGYWIKVLDATGSTLGEYRVEYEEKAPRTVRLWGGKLPEENPRRRNPFLAQILGGTA